MTMVPEWHYFGVDNETIKGGSLWRLKKERNDLAVQALATSLMEVQTRCKIIVHQKTDKKI